MEKKKKHHYVWKEYLRSWCFPKEKIHTLIKSKDKLISPNLIGVVQERFYYGLEDFTIEEEEKLEGFVRKLSVKNLLNSNLILFNIYTTIPKMKRILEVEKLDEQKTKKIDDIISIFKTNAIEDFHSSIENLGNKIIKIKLIEDLFFLNDDHEEFYTLYFLCNQYLRTKKNKVYLEKNISEFENIIPKYINLISLIFAQNLALGLANKKIKYIFYDNTTEIDFITSDQPVINLFKDLKDKNGFPKFFELYYPISPKIAILIHHKEQNDKYEYNKISKSKVNELNKFVFKNAEEFVFSTSEKQLNEIKIVFNLSK